MPTFPVATGVSSQQVQDGLERWAAGAGVWQLEIYTPWSWRKLYHDDRMANDALEVGGLLEAQRGSLRRLLPSFRRGPAEDEDVVGAAMQPSASRW
jgi:hypothetical protein